MNTKRPPTPSSLQVGMLGNCAYSALVDQKARIVWCCLPRFDGEPVFDAILDPGENGSLWAFELEDYERSEHHYEPNTAVLHTRLYDRTGQGRGVVGVRTNWIPTNLQEDRVKAFNDGEIFHVLSNGRRAMPPYKFQITEHDRWAIVAYVRALQRTTSGTVEDVPQELRADLR